MPRPRESGRERREKAEHLAPSHLDAARRIAQKSLVLLKNDGGVLDFVHREIVRNQARALELPAEQYLSARIEFDGAEREAYAQLLAAFQHAERGERPTTWPSFRYQ